MTARGAIATIGMLAGLLATGATAADSAASAPAAQGRVTAPAPAQAPKTASAASTPGTTAGQPGSYSAMVMQLPKVRECNPKSRPMSMGSGPGHESFSVICANGYGLFVQCTGGECKVMN